MMLRVRSGKQPEPAVRPEAEEGAEAWSRTRAAVRGLEETLQCSACSSVLKEPVCLGGCEHVFCRTCVGESVGSECPMCHTPAWVRDVQINRQLDNMIQLCSKLKNLLNKGKIVENKMDLCPYTSLKIKATPEGECKKKQIKMWFSPRSRKMRCVLEKETKIHQIPSNVLSSYEFVSSSPNVEPVKKKPVSRPRKSKKKKLVDINQEWGLGEQEKTITILECGKQPKPSRTVSFCSPPVVLQSPDTSQEPKISETEENGQDQSECDFNKPLKGQLGNREAITVEHTRMQNLTPEKVIKRTPAKRKCRQDESLFSSVSKRPRKIENGVVNSSSKEKHSELILPIKVSSKPLKACEKPTPVKARNTHKGGTVLAKSPLSSPAHTKEAAKVEQSGAFIQTSPSTFPNSKKNHKGETMLHLASIKGDVQGAEELLKAGANPNVKDNAGWTPLHEACSHGHKDIVELLLQHQALVNTAGYQNDTPLHDAARNGHSTIVSLLLCHGASRDAVNIFGLRPVDYAETEEIKSALLQTQTNKEPRLARPNPVLSPCQKRGGAIVFLASGLSASQRNDVDKLAALLKAESCTEYTTTVTHLIIGEEHMLRTMKCMLGTLAGCWILGFAWVKACLESGGQESEEPYEIPSGPCRARLNREQLLPRLLDGCHFYFLGFFREHRKEDLAELVKAAGGQILTRQPKPESDVTQTINTVAYHAEAGSDQRFCTQYIIYDKASKYQPGKVRQGKVWVAPSSWLVECITSFQLLPVYQ